MVVRRDKKVKRQRAATTHGYGSMKKNRGAGHRGGRGNAGSGKRGDSKKPKYWKNGLYRKGKTGFKSRTIKGKALSVSTLDRMIDSLLASNKVTSEDGVYDVDLSKLGYSKLIGNGKTIRNMRISVDKASERARKKIEEAGGSLVNSTNGEN